MRKVIFLSTALLIAVNLQAQTDADALRYSGSSLSGTSRFTSMSGAFSALGGDFTTLSFNPAGIGIYRTSEFTFTPSVFVGSTSAKFLGKTFDENRYNFNIGNAGLIFNKQLSKNQESAGWKSWSFGLGYNRLNNFHNRSFSEGTNPTSSLLQSFAENANGMDYSNLDPFAEYLAYNTYLINPDSGGLNYTSIIPGGGALQRRTSETRGSMGETVFAFGGNYSNKFYLGGSLNFTNLRYTEETIYEESDPEEMIDSIDQFRFEQNLTTTGNGFNVKLGFIYRPAENVRIGIAMHSPTWYKMHDSFINFMDSKFDAGTVYSDESPEGAFDYDLTTPFKALGGVAVIFQTFGLVSADYEFSDYSQTRFDAQGFPFSDVNNSIRNKYTGVHTFRFGTEWKYQNISFRGGTSYSTSPFTSPYKVSSNDFSKMNFSGGIGFRENDFFLDLGYLYSQSNQFFQPYRLQSTEVPGVTSTNRSHNFTLTFGAKF
jgi:hypothetical protein